jgi:RNA polymerase sigma factor (sigma-70 family)
MQRDKSKSSKPRRKTSGLLQRLSSRDPGPAWVEFLDRYSQLIMNTASQFEYEQDRIDDCFIFVCEKLNDDGFRRLLNFNPRGTAKFRTWLATVVFNLCIDWHRKEFGRVTLLPAISALPAFDQSVYRLVVEQGMNKESAYQLLKADFPELTREMVVISLRRIYSLLTPRQRWQIGVRNRGRRSNSSNGSPNQLERLPDPGADPEQLAQDRQELESLQRAMSHLPRNQRLLLQLRFQEGLSLAKIAELRNLGDSNRVWRHIQRATRSLTRAIRKSNLQKKRKN